MCAVHTSSSGKVSTGAVSSSGEAADWKEAAGWGLDLHLNDLHNRTVSHTSTLRKQLTLCTVLDNGDNDDDNSDYDDNVTSITVTLITALTMNFLTILSQSLSPWPHGRTTDTLGITSAGEGVRH